MLELRSVEARYGAAVALRDISLSVGPADLVSIVGPNGAGKTTLINVIAGIHRAAAGTMTLGTRDLTRLPAWRFCDEGVAIVPEGRHLFTSMTVRENLELGSYRSEAKASRRESLERVASMFPPLAEWLDRPAGTLSGGQQQMAAIARALMARPRVLLLDEPSLGLAPVIVLELFKIIRRVNAEGVAVLLVEQNVAMALDIATRAYVLEQGPHRCRRRPRRADEGAAAQGGISRRGCPGRRRRRGQLVESTSGRRVRPTGRSAMNRSTDRFLTTHTGSLPRPDDLIRTMFAKEEGVPVEAAALDARVALAVEEVVAKQAEAGVDVIDDGEMSKPSYATYIKDRLAGFGGEGNTFVYQDLVDFPRLAKRVFGDPGRSRRKTPACNAPIAVRDPQAVVKDVRHLKAATAKVNVAGAFMTAASPGVVSLFFRNEHYPTEEAYLAAIAEAMRYEYETITNAGITLQIDCPDLGMGRHIQHADLSLPEWRKKAELHVEALNHALANVSPGKSAHASLLGKLRGAAPLRRRARRRDRHRVQGEAQRSRAGGRKPSPRARMGALREIEASRRQGADSRRDRIEVELRRASRAHRAANRALCEPRGPRERHGGQRLRLWNVGWPIGGRSRRRLGEDGRDGRRRAHRIAPVLEDLTFGTEADAMVSHSRPLIDSRVACSPIPCRVRPTARPRRLPRRR
jgi:ABC-type branched-subunit amino acid transport system ATPase component/methionine synthase II (cobalamin-independent)